MDCSKNKRFCLYGPVFSSMTSYKELIDFAAKYSIPAVEGLNLLFELTTPDLEVARELRRYADERGVVFSCMSLGIDLVGEDTLQAIETAKRYADVAAILGSPYLHHTIAFNFSNPKAYDADPEMYFQRGLAAVRAVYDYAESIGIRTIFENQGYLFNGVKNFGRFLKEVDRNVGVVIDVGNIYYVDESIEGFVEAFMPRACHVHIKDMVYTPAAAVSEEPENDGHTRNGYVMTSKIGEGSVNFKEVLPAIEKAGYTGYYALEYSAMNDEEQDFVNSLEYLQKCLGL